MRILSEIDVIEKMLQDCTNEAFLADEKTQRAVCMTLINIGELAKSLSYDFRAACTGLPWRAITGL